jgi:acyl-coenzyme A thioesterase PaaI-like protein
MTVENKSAFPWQPFQSEYLHNALNTGYGLWCGMKLVEARPGFARLSFKPRAEMLTPWGTLSGSVINGVLEMPAFVALLTELDQGLLPVTNDFFLQHVRPLPGDVEYELVGTLLRKGKTMAWAESTALVDGKPVSYARITKSLTKTS